MDHKPSVLQQSGGVHQFLVAVELDPEDAFLEFPVMVDAYILNVDVVDRQDGGDLRDQAGPVGDIHVDKVDLMGGPAVETLWADRLWMVSKLSL